MDRKKCDSSLETVYSFSDYEETLSESQKFKSKEKLKQEKKSFTHSENSKSKSSTTKSHKSKIHISQQIQVENKDFQCVINLNTNVYEHKSRNREKRSQKDRSLEEKRETKKSTKTTSNNRKNKDKNCHKTRQKKDYSSREREVPSCCRRNCWSLLERREEKSRRRQILTSAHRISERCERYENKKSSRTDKMEQEVRQRAKKHHKNKAKTEIKQTQCRVLLSPISSTPFQDTKDEISYDEISSDSLDITNDDVRKPKSQKHHRRHSKHCKRRHHKHSSSKLDALIKRTKERERKMVEESRNWFTSTPITLEFSSSDFPMTCSDMDMSINPASTVLLESPTYQSYLHACSESEKLNNTKELSFKKENQRSSCETVKLSDYQPYSPSSPIKEVYTPVNQTTEYSPSSPIKEVYTPINKTTNYSPSPPISEDNTPKKETKAYKLFKEEPKIKIEVYSPTHSTELTPKLYNFTDLKQDKEIKPEPPFPLELSPINKNNNDLNLDGKFCKMESVKMELMFV